MLTHPRNHLHVKMLLMKNFVPMGLPEESFGDWLQKEREKHGWSQAELGNLSGLGRSAINKLENHDQQPTTHNCVNLADPFGMPPEDIMRVARLLPPKRGDDPIANKINFIVSKLPTEDDRQDVLDYVEMRHRIAEKRGKFESKEKKAGPSKP
jgi:transcriptional regulator with XRE-family HTH domain